MEMQRSARRKCRSSEAASFSAARHRGLRVESLLIPFQSITRDQSLERSAWRSITSCVSRCHFHPGAEPIRDCRRRQQLLLRRELLCQIAQNIADGKDADGFALLVHDWYMAIAAVVHAV